jgi:hypothetical protein
MATSDKFEYLQLVFDTGLELSKEFHVRVLQVADERRIDPAVLVDAVSTLLMAARAAGWEYDQRVEKAAGNDD